MQRRIVLSFRMGIYECRSKCRSKCRRRRAISSRSVRNDKSQRCILTSGTAHHKSENIMLLWFTIRVTGQVIFLPLFLLSVSASSLLLSMKRKHPREIRPSRAAEQKIRRRVTRNKKYHKLSFPSTNITLRHCIMSSCRCDFSHPCSKIPGRETNFEKRAADAPPSPTNYNIFGKNTATNK